MNDHLMIKPLKPDSDLTPIVEIIRASFRTVADQLGLNRSNCPSHPSLISKAKLRASIDQGLQCFVLLQDDRPIGFVGMKRLDERRFTLEKLAVLPDQRHKGYGKMLVDHVCQAARDAGAKEVHIGIIDEHTVLKQWYQGLGFEIASVERFDHLPFTVCLMMRDAIPPRS